KAQCPPPGLRVLKREGDRVHLAIVRIDHELVALAASISPNGKEDVTPSGPVLRRRESVLEDREEASGSNRPCQDGWLPVRPSDLSKLHVLVGGRPELARIRRQRLRPVVPDWLLLQLRPHVHRGSSAGGEGDRDYHSQTHPRPTC